MPPKVFTGRRPLSELTTPVFTSKIMDGGRPTCPQQGQEFGLTDSVRDMAVRCWHKDPTQRPTMKEVVRLVRELSVFSISLRNKRHNMPPTATGWLLCGLESRIFQSRS